MVAIKAFPQLKGYIQLNSAEGESLPRQPKKVERAIQAATLPLTWMGGCKSRSAQERRMAKNILKKKMCSREHKMKKLDKKRQADIMIVRVLPVR